jgi:pyruvate/2-oxoglutarate dehydrogenase complex dihydrolipoamide acyltransferase (E2) component
VLALLEAMKMEHEVRSPDDGVVRAVQVEPGQQVNAGDVLVVVERRRRRLPHDRRTPSPLQQRRRGYERDSVTTRGCAVRTSFPLATLAIALAVGMGGRALAADEIDDALSGAGKVWYDKYCTPCHGPGGAVSRATKQPVDLRTYVARHGGKFPAADLLAVIADTRPASVHSAVWERIQKGQTGAVVNEAAARGVVGLIARYIVSIQAK